MKITTAQLAGTPEKIGELDGRPVMEMATKGGLHLVVTIKKNGSTETLGTGSSRALARYVARKMNPELKVSALAKSEDAPAVALGNAAPEFFALTRRIRVLE